MKVLKHCILKTSVFFTLFLAASVTSNAQNRKIGINTVVIDAGHGGPDAGAVGRLYKEKDINLDVALRFGRMISEHYPDVQVIYTRKTDVLIPLAERGDIANRAKADLFISIHINSNKSSSPSGVSVYVMGVDKASKNMDVAMKENDVITYEEDYSGLQAGIDRVADHVLADAVRIPDPKLPAGRHGAEAVRRQHANAGPGRPPSGLSGAVARRDAEHPVRVRIHFEPDRGKVHRIEKGTGDLRAEPVQRFQPVQGPERGPWHTDCS